MYDFIIIGAGVFGTTAALELAQSQSKVLVLDQGNIPFVNAASTDISKVVRMEYGVDEDYMAMGEMAIDGWHQWNGKMDEPLYHETGLLSLSHNKMVANDYPFESFKLLNKRNHRPERLNAQSIKNNFPAWSEGHFKDGFYHHKAGFVESGRVIKWLIQKCHHSGIEIREQTKVNQLLIKDGTAYGVVVNGGEIIKGGQTIVAAGAWTKHLVPGTNHLFQVTGHPVFHFKPKNPRDLKPVLFPTFMADVSRTGWYGFPVHPTEGVVKIARHAIGEFLHPVTDDRLVRQQEIEELWRFIKMHLPSLTDANLVFTRKCLYSDTIDHHFLIDHHPDIKNLVVASGGSGHGFKFAPILGQLISSVISKVDQPFKQKFSWRHMIKTYSDASRCISE